MARGRPFTKYEKRTLTRLGYDTNKYLKGGEFAEYIELVNKDTNKVIRERW